MAARWKMELKFISRRTPCLGPKVTNWRGMPCRVPLPRGTIPKLTTGSDLTCQLSHLSDLNGAREPDKLSKFHSAHTVPHVMRVTTFQASHVKMSYAIQWVLILWTELGVLMPNPSC